MNAIGHPIEKAEPGAFATGVTTTSVPSVSGGFSSQLKLVTAARQLDVPELVGIVIDELEFAHAHLGACGLE
jgi:hypothetical protein